jgi:hypothetical protein
MDFLEQTDGEKLQRTIFDSVKNGFTVGLLADKPEFRGKTTHYIDCFALRSLRSIYSLHGRSSSAFSGERPRGRRRYWRRERRR